MPKSDRLIESSDWIDLEFVEHERTPEPIIEMGIQLHLAGLSLSNTKRYLEKWGVQRSRTAIHNWVHKAELEPAPETEPTEIALDEKAINVDGTYEWLFAAIDTATNELLYVCLFQTRTTERTLLFLHELQTKYDLDHVTFLVDDAHYLKGALARLGLRFQASRHGNRNYIERVFRDVERRTSSFVNTFRNTPLDTAES